MSSAALKPLTTAELHDFAFEDAERGRYDRAARLLRRAIREYPSKGALAESDCAQMEAQASEWGRAHRAALREAARS